MFRVHIRGPSGGSVPTQSARAKDAASPIHADPDDQLCVDCLAYKNQLDALVSGLQCAAAVRPDVYEQVAASLDQAAEVMFAQARRISATATAGPRGLRSKLAVAALLFSSRYSECPPERGALLLSALDDARRLNYPAAIGGAAASAAGHKASAAGAACLALVMQVAAGVAQVARSRGLTSREEDDLVHDLYALQQQQWMAVSQLARTPATSIVDAECKAKVLLRLLDMEPGCSEPAAGDLALSYLMDLDTVVQIKDGGCEASTPVRASGSVVGNFFWWKARSSGR